MKRRHGMFVLAFMVILLLALLPSRATAEQREKLSFRFTVFLNGLYGPYYLALERGYYKQAGLALQFFEGRGSGKNIQILASGAENIAAVDYATMTKAVAKGVPVKAIFAELQQSPMSVIVWADSPIRTPKELEGKTVGATVGDSSTQIFPAFLAANGVDASKVRIVNMAARAKNVSLLQRKVDSILHYFFHAVPLLEGKGAKVRFFKYSAYGVNLLSNGIMANHHIIKEKPELVRRFINATSKGWQEALKEPKDAIDALMRAGARGTAELQLKILKNGITLLHTDNTRGKPIGFMAKKDWEQSQELLLKYGRLEKKLPVDTYYTNEFIQR